MEFINGIRIGEYGVDLDTLYDELEERLFSRGMNYVAFSFDQFDVPLEKYREVAHAMADRGVYFTFTFAHRRFPYGADPEFFAEIKRYAGKYYLANFVCELGSTFGCTGTDYGIPELPHKTLEDAKAAFIEHMKDVGSNFDASEKIEYGIIEATGLISYLPEAGINVLVLETMCGNPEIMIPLLRGTARANNSKAMITYIAHEWYGGCRNDDELKQKRLRMIYDYAYMSGTDGFVLESGDLCIRSHGMREGGDHEIVRRCNDTLRDFAAFANADDRPSGGPVSKIAFIQGHLDGWSPWNSGSSVWNGFSKKEHGYASPEFTWRIMDDIAHKRAFCDYPNFGERDLSGAPAYGSFDIVNINTPPEALDRYDTAIFVGWNTMTEKTYELLKRFVARGGTLIMSVAHLNTNDTRDGQMKLFRDGDVSELFGCKLDANNPYETFAGIKFNESIAPGFLYPADENFDPLFSAGYASYANVSLTTGCEAAYTSGAFEEKMNKHRHTALIENKLGRGTAILLTGLDYPSSGTLYGLYRTVVREAITASHRAADIKVIGSDSLRFSVYEGGHVYLLNTDFDVPAFAIVEAEGKKEQIMLDPCELKHIKI